MPPLTHPRWLVMSDIHFQLRDIERINRTAEWIVSLVRQTPDINRVVISGDVLTARSMQPTAVISAAYRFLSNLSDAVPHVNMILGNHDLAYRRDYRTTALEALRMTRLREFISVHDDVGRYTWDGRDVLVLPFREDQSELTDAVAGMDPGEAAQTVAFAHLAINKAVTQRHVVRDDSGALGFPVLYRGFVGPDHFSPLARTFTGHFHSHQTLHHPPAAESDDPLKGSLTYIGSPLQLTWADLLDEDRGVILLNPATLKHELIVNPYGIAYVTVQAAEVLEDSFDESIVQNKNVMMLGSLSKFKYWTARDKLLSLGAQSVREQRAMPALRGGVAFHSLGASVPISDRAVALTPADPSDTATEMSGSPAHVKDATSTANNARQPVEVNPVEHVREYVRSLSLDSMYEEKTIHLGERLILACESTTFVDDNANYKTLLDPSQSIGPSGDFSAPTKQVFVAKPQSITISNFLGVQGESTIKFDGELGRGLTFVIGANGSGKSTLIEAIVWCQFGRCIRKGLAVGDVVNDSTGKDCMVSLSFSNGFTITRYRKHHTHGNRVVVSLNGVEQPQYEHGDVRNTQVAMNDLLGIEYEEFIKTVVLGHESATGFLSSTPVQRHELIDSTLGVSLLDKSAELSRKMLRQVDGDTAAFRSQIDSIGQTISHIERRIADKGRELERLQKEKETAKEAIDSFDPGPEPSDASRAEELNWINESLEEVNLQVKDTQQKVDELQSDMKEVEIWEELATLRSASDQSIQKLKSYSQAVRHELLKIKSAQPDPEAMERAHSIKSVLGILAETISWIQVHALDATEHIRPDNQMGRTALHFLRLSLMSLAPLAKHINHIAEQSAPPVAKEQENHAEATEKLQIKLVETESNVDKLTKEGNEIYANIARNRGLDEQYVRSVSEKLTKADLQNIKQQLSTSLNQLTELLRHQRVLHDQQAKQQQNSVNAGISDGEKQRAALEENLAQKEQEITIYQRLIEEETSILNEQITNRDAIGAELESLLATRELFSFWEESLSRRRTKAATTPTFRGLILDKCLQELNSVASEILLVLYENTPHARELTTGMLRTIIGADAENDQSSGGPQLLDQSLGVTKELSYAKRSGGERKRIDLAVFFALVQILRARSTHRARYILVDEAFDSLDTAGQAAVVRWCLQPLAWTDFQLVVTHSEYLTNSARGATAGEGSDLGSQFSILSAVKTKDGTTFSVNVD